MSVANVVDSSGWLEYFADSERASLFAPAVEDEENLVVPIVCIYEVFKKVLRERGERCSASREHDAGWSCGRFGNITGYGGRTTSPVLCRPYYLRSSDAPSGNPLDAGRAFQRPSVGILLPQTRTLTISTLRRNNTSERGLTTRLRPVVSDVDGGIQGCRVSFR